MRNRIRNFVLGAAAVGLAIVGAGPALAGQAGSNTTVSGGSRTSSGSISVGSIQSSWNETVNTGSTQTDSTRVTLSLQISDEGYHGYSPSRNLATFEGTLANAASIGVVGTASGITSNQQTIGNANVTVHANTLIDASALANIFSDSSAATGANAVMVLNPAFAISNSALAARVLAVEAMSGVVTAGASSSVTAIDFVGRDTFEMSPERNVASFASNLTNDVNIGNASGITQSQQQIGNANVQTGFNTIVFSSGSGSSLPMP